ncbi:hypothetical protein DW047_16315 [Phocaeicola vulgatus]|nr:hypothetical protein DW990_09865 [Phocaeicola vulgatus]RHK78318.1 hypothetical protein DW047_16315 [Phocaeicola vulgatus]
MVTVEILEIEVLFCTYVWVTSYILMVEKAIKRLVPYRTSLFLYACIRDYSPQFIASIRL